MKRYLVNNFIVFFVSMVVSTIILVSSYKKVITTETMERFIQKNVRVWWSRSSFSYNQHIISFIHRASKDCLVYSSQKKRFTFANKVKCLYHRQLVCKFYCSIEVTNRFIKIFIYIIYWENVVHILPMYYARCSCNILSTLWFLNTNNL